MLMDAVASSSYQGSFPGQPRRPNADMGYDSQGLASLISEKLNGFDGYAYGYSSSSGGIPESTTLPPTQSLPTSVLYERARQAAVAKSSAHARREGLHSTRRPWTPEEEKALMAGLDMVKGPHWSQILQLFGQNGTISDILKDRTQVQLKDKARNLKLFFLKTNSEMPYYLQCVTGELKTRAPSQAARKEAEEQARVQAGGSPVTYASSYANGTTNGATTLVQGLSSAGFSRPNPTGSNPGSSTPGATAGSSHQPQQSYQQQQSYQNHRTQQLQPAANGTTHSSHTSSQQAVKPLSAQSQHHQPIAPAPAYQRPLQQAPATSTSQYQQRHVQQAATPAPASYQQAHQHPQRPSAATSTSMIPPRPATNSATLSRPLSAVSQIPATNTRPASALSASSSRPQATTAHSAAPSPASGLATTSKSIPTIMPAPPSSASPSPAPTSTRHPQHIPAKISQPPAAAGGIPHAQIPAATTTTTAAPVMPAPPEAAPNPAPKPAEGSASTAAPTTSANSQADGAQKTSDAADDELLIKSLQAALQQSG